MKLILLALMLMVHYVVLSQDLVILHTNDIHSHLNGFSPEAEYTPLENDGDPTRGGFSRIAGFINAQKEIHGDNVLVLDAGDFLMGTLFQTLELKEGFQLNLMKKMGYDYVALGNHEFDFGPNSLARIINLSRLNGEIPSILLSNYKGSVNIGDSDFVELMAESVIMPYAIKEVNGYKIGLLALVGDDAEESIPQKFGIEFYNPLKIAKRTARYLKRNEKVDMVIVLSHSGVKLNAEGIWGGEDIILGKKVPDIDLIISGHSHSYISTAAYAGTTPVVQTGSSGTSVGRIEVMFDFDGKPLFQTSLVAMDDNIAADVEIQELIDDKVVDIEENILSEIGVGYYDYVVETTFDLLIDEHAPDSSNLGPFVADAIRYYVDKKAADGVDVSLVASGVIRNNIETGNKGFQNINDIFNVLPLGMGNEHIPGSPLGLIYVTGNELKKVMELIFAVHEKLPAYYLYYSGMEIDFDQDKGLFRKISSIRIGDEVKGYRDIDISRKSTDMVSVTANNYMIGFMGKLKRMSFGLVKVEPKKSDGTPVIDNDFLVDIDPDSEGVQEAKEWLSVYYYIQSFTDEVGNGIPRIPLRYK
jgi:5'-nucleotidase